MKTTRIFLPMVVVAHLFLSCKKENLEQTMMLLKPDSGQPDTDCGWLPCEQVIAENQDALQPLANSLCDTVWVDITCCHDGLETCALVFVAPNCGITKVSVGRHERRTLSEENLEEANTLANMMSGLIYMEATYTSN